MMLKLFFLNPLFLLLSVTGYGQKCVVANMRENLAYLGVPNPLDIAVNGYLCRNFEVSTDNGKIEASGEVCSYTYYPGKIGIAEIIVTEKKSGKALGSVRFRIKDIPLPFAKVAGKSGGDVRKNVFKAQLGIVTVLEGFDFDAHFPVERFTISIFRNDKVVFEERTEGAKFSTQTKITFDKLEANDKIVFANIDCKAPDGRIRRLSPIEFRIIE